jgi:hypothetical protein
MGLSILKYFWFILVLASGLVAALLGSSRYGVKIDFASWARISSKILNEIPVILKSPLIESYGFYGGLILFLVFVVLFVTTSRAVHKNRIEPVGSVDTSTEIRAQSTVSQSDDNQPNRDYLDEALSRTETLSSEAEFPSNQDESSDESIEYVSEDEWIASVQKYKNRDE